MKLKIFCALSIVLIWFVVTLVWSSAVQPDVTVSVAMRQMDNDATAPMLMRGMRQLSSDLFTLFCAALVVMIFFGDVVKGIKKLNS